MGADGRYIISAPSLTSMEKLSAAAFQTSNCAESRPLHASARSPRVSSPALGMALYMSYSICHVARVLASQSAFGDGRGSERQPLVTAHGTPVLMRKDCAIRSHTKTVLNLAVSVTHSVPIKMSLPSSGFCKDPIFPCNAVTLTFVNTERLVTHSHKTLT